MTHNSIDDREFFQNVLASAFTMQQRLGVERLTRNRSNAIGVVVDPLHDQLALPQCEEDDQSDTIMSLIEEGAHEELSDFSDNVFDGNMDSSEDHCCHESELAVSSSTPAPGIILPSPTDILDSRFLAFRIYRPEVKTARVWLRDSSVLLQLILVIALALLLGWMLGRVSSRKSADKKVSTSLSAKQGAAIVQPEANRQTEQMPQPLGSGKPRNPATPHDSLVIYEGGKVIFRGKEGEDADFTNAKSTKILPHAESGPSRPTTARLLRRVEPEYPEAARQQQLAGSVLLEALVGEDGTVKQLGIISGNSLLATAASDAVRQWRFTPLVQNGQAVQFQTRIKIDYVLP